MDDFASNVCKSKIASIMAIGELFMLEPEQREDRGVQIVDADFVDDGFVSKLIGFAIVRPALDATSRKPRGKCVGIVIASGGGTFLRYW